MDTSLHPRRRRIVAHNLNHLFLGMCSRFIFMEMGKVQMLRKMGQRVRHYNLLEGNNKCSTTDVV